MSGALAALSPVALRRRRRLRQAYRAVFGGDDGRLVLRDLINRNHGLATSLHAGDPQLTAFNEGRRAAMLDILGRLRWTEDDLTRLTLETTDDA